MLTHYHKNGNETSKHELFFNLFLIFLHSFTILFYELPYLLSHFNWILGRKLVKLLESYGICLVACIMYCICKQYTSRMIVWPQCFSKYVKFEFPLYSSNSSPNFYGCYNEYLLTAHNNTLIYALLLLHKSFVHLYLRYYCLVLNIINDMRRNANNFWAHYICPG